jgi:hydrogenase-4 component B
MDVRDERDRSADSGPKRGSHGVLATVCGAVVVIGACSLGLIPTIQVLGGGPSLSVSVPWDLPHGDFSFGLDCLSAFFLLPVLVLSALAAVYGASYLLPYRGKKSLGTSWFFFATFVAGMIMVLIARTALLFLVSWEAMSLSAYFLVTFEHEKADVRRAGWIYLVAAHLGVAFLLATFFFLGRQAGGLDFEAFSRIPAIAAGPAGLIFVSALIGFGAKAGFVPFHVWLPEAHPAAPSHVSALMSGAMIKMGLYGLLRVVSFIGPPAPWWGLSLGALGLLTALVGISLALYQRDMKRVLAYSSIENMGLIGLAFGVGLFGSATGLSAVAVLGTSAGLLHIWNHALMKCLMFFAAGSVLHGTGTKDLEKLGGVAKRMPWTGVTMIIGAVAISALPPLNGFVSKWLIYLSLMKYGLTTGGGRGLTALLAVGVLALVGGLAGIAFVRLTGIALLGSPRSEAARHAHESAPWMLAPMACLMFLCLVAAVFPQEIARLFPGIFELVLGKRAGQAFPGLEPLQAGLSTLGLIDACTIIALGATLAAIVALLRAGAKAQGPTWGCGYLAPTERMQYTGGSFAEMMAEHLLPRVLRPRTTRQAPRGLFPSASEFGEERPDPISEMVYDPFFRRWAERFSRLRILQQGKVNVYLVYVVFMVVLALAWVSFRGYWSAS